MTKTSKAKNRKKNTSENIRCSHCARLFTSRKGYNIHISTNTICILNASPNDDTLKGHDPGVLAGVQKEPVDTHEDTSDECWNPFDAPLNPSDNQNFDGIQLIDCDDHSVNPSDHSSDTSSSTDKCSNVILHQRNRQMNRPDAILSTDDIHASQLAKILHTANGPLYLFDSIMKWASNATRCGYEFPNIPLSRKSFFKGLYERYDLTGIRPQLKTITLPCSSQVIQVVSLDFEQLLLSLLSDEDLMTEDNLLFENGNPFSVPRRRVNKVGDVNTGSWYINAYKKLCNNVNDVLVPIILFIDGVTIDMYSHLNLEPVTFTLGIFNRSTRNKAYAWRTLGFINDLSLKSSIPRGESTKMGDNLRDYHKILETILTPLIDLQERGGFKWKFYLNGHTYPENCKVPVQFIIGDCKSQDGLCGRYGSHNCHSICRDCDCTFENSDDPDLQCVPLKASYINELIKDNDINGLKGLSFHTHENAFTKICFGGDVYGINGATPPELLHEFRQGVFDICLDGFIGICGKPALEWIDCMCQKISIHTSHQSDRQFPRTSFPKGITSLSKVTADEKIGVLLILFLAMYTKSGMAKFFHPEFASYRALFHHLLVFHAFLLKEEHLTYQFVEMEKQVRKCMHFIKEVVKRQVGNGFRFPKFHQILHALRNISRFGSMRNFDGGPAECHGKTNAKQPARLTQKRAHNLALQSGERISEGLALEFRLRHLRHRGLINDSPSRRNEDVDCNSSYGGTKYIISFPEDYNGRNDVNIEWCGVTRCEDTKLSPCLLSFLCDEVLPKFTSDSITCYTEYKRSGVIFRAHPAYRSSMEWYDWAIVKFFDDGISPLLYPSKICCFVQDDDECGGIDNLRVIIRCAEERETNFQDNYSYPIVNRLVLNDHYDMVPVSNIHNTCFVIPDIDTGEDGNKKGVIIVHPMDKWGDEFINLKLECI